MKLTITIDTEEDNWGHYDSDNYSLKNIERISRLQDLFDCFGFKPTYLVTYPVATNDPSVRLLKSILKDGRCEIGTHCHPWNTPPFVEKRIPFNSMLCNLPAELQYRKILKLHNSIIDSFGVIPISFRAGRWGLKEDTVNALDRLGYLVDSSVLAFWNWQDYHGPDYSKIFPKPFMWDNHRSIISEGHKGLLEVPATGGFAQRNFQVCNLIWSFFEGEISKKIPLKGILDRLQLLNKIWLSPETSSSVQMIALASAMIKQRYKILNMFFHSTSLMAGLSPFVQSKNDESEFLRRIEEFLTFARNMKIESVRLGDIQDDDI